MDTITNWLELDTTSDSKITAVTVYPGYAEVTRSYPLTLQAGVTEVAIVGGLDYTGGEPNILRLEKEEGSVVLRDVKVMQSSQDPDQTTETSDAISQLQDLQNQKELLEKSLARCNYAPILFSKYMASLKMENIDIEKLDQVLEAYNNLERKWDEKVQILRNQIRVVEEKITGVVPRKEEKSPKDLKSKSSLLDIRFILETAVAVDLHVRLVYGVVNASWAAEYDITAVSNNTEEKLSLTYKAVVINETAEPWDDVVLTLGTVEPPGQDRKLPTWEVSLGNPAVQRSELLHSVRYVPSAKHFIKGKVSVLKRSTPTMIEIAQLTPPVSFERFCTPRNGCDVKLIAKITNDNQYPFYSGDANVYLNENFILKTSVSVICSGEAFNVPLGLDPTVRMTYHPFTKTITTEQPTSTYSSPKIFHRCSRRITIFNSRGITIPSLIVIDSAPTSAGGKPWTGIDWPPLRLSQDVPVSVTDNIPEGSSISARWDNIEEPWSDTKSLGQNSKVNWVCIVGPGAELDLDLRWTVYNFGTERIGYF